MPIPTKGMATKNQPKMFLMPTRVQLRYLTYLYPMGANKKKADRQK